METDIEKKGPESLAPGTTTALRISDNTPIDLNRQTGSFENRTNVQLFSDTSGYIKHPYYQIQEMLEEALWMLDRARKQKSKRFCIAKLKTALAYIERIRHLLTWYERCAASLFGEAGKLGEVGSRLRWAAESMTHAIEDSDPELSPQLGAKEAAQDLEEAQQILVDLTAADEDALYPGYRNEEGELIVRGLQK